MSEKRADRRANLKVPPLRQAGQSVDEKMREIRDDFIERYLLVGAMFLLAAMEWAHKLVDARPFPWVFTAVAVAILIYERPKFLSDLAQYRRLKLGRDGERVVGQGLEELRAKGWLVIHDLVLDGYNIDHVLIGTKGIFAIETKTWRKLPGLPTSIGYDGHHVHVSGFTPSRNPISQAEAEAHALADLIQKQTGKAVSVRPVVLFPERFIEKQPHGAKVWVLNPKSLPSFLAHEKEAFSQQDVDFIYARLSDFVRTSNQC